MRLEFLLSIVEVGQFKEPQVCPQAQYPPGGGASRIGGAQPALSGAPPQQLGRTFSVAYRLRLLFLGRWNQWPRLTRYRTWRGPAGETVDGTNNGCERAIGWWIKERYRTMRSYKRKLSAINLSRFMA